MRRVLPTQAATAMRAPGWGSVEWVEGIGVYDG